MNKAQSYEIVPTNKDKNQGITFRELYEDILSEIEDYKKLGLLDELMTQTVKLNLVDLNGRVIDGPATLTVGWLEGGSVLITGNVEEIYG
ncbi:hypothetical protein MKY95_18905 [Paenibacillus sp. FSL P4-0176]|uniref:hypothetical protein n=1 Tax=Paenibacillus sp. FSL P4-0176 TaxID=2921631 RepID=UPI0030CA8056